MADIFISYAKADRDVAQRLAGALEAQGWSVWWDLDIPAGKDFDKVIEAELDAATSVVVLWSKHSVDSRYVKGEAREAQSQDKLIPAFIEHVKPPMDFRAIQGVFLMDWDGAEDFPAFKQLVGAIERIMGKMIPGPKVPPDSGKVRGRPSNDEHGTLEKAAQLSLEPTASPAEGKSIEFEFIGCPAGEFDMGSENGGDDEKPVRRVRISREFQLGKYPVTQEKWETVMGSNPSKWKGAKRPVEKVSWNDVQRFIKMMNERKDGYVYRLPTEAEWEYACRAGSTGDYSGDVDEIAWYWDNSGKERLDAARIWATDPRRAYGRLARNLNQTHPVGQKLPNAWGFCDMYGNVNEWVHDWYHKEYYGSRPDPDTDPLGPESDEMGIMARRGCRGGSYKSEALRLRSAARGGFTQSQREETCGFRLLRQPE